MKACPRCGCGDEELPHTPDGIVCLSFQRVLRRGHLEALRLVTECLKDVPGEWTNTLVGYCRRRLARKWRYRACGCDPVSGERLEEER